jgi:dTMP kinase
MLNNSGVFISFEGGEGSGKSSIVKDFSAYLNSLGIKNIATSEPGGNRNFFGKKIRELILGDESIHILPKTEVLLFAADRAQHVGGVILPALSVGTIVLCDRYIDSSVVYQGVVRDLGTKEVSKISEWAADDLYPDLTFLLDVDPIVGLERRTKAGEENRIDKESIEFHYKVREGFLTLAEGDPNRFVVLDASQNKTQILDEIVLIFREKYPNLFQ